jgi:putative ABC transport system permease protein
MPGSTQTRGISRGAGSLNTLTMDDVEKLEEEAALVRYVSPIINAPGQVIAAGKNWSTNVQGVSPYYLEIRDWSLEKGTFFTERDTRSRRKVAVLGKSVVDELFGEQEPLGAKIRIRNVPFTVIGVLSEKGQSMMGDQDDVILAPSTTVLYRMSDGRTVNTIMVSAVSLEQMEAAQEEIEQLIREEHKLRQGEDDDFFIRSQTDIIQRVTSVTGILTMLLGAIAGVSLLVGGIGIMNIMLVSVTERTKERAIQSMFWLRAKRASSMSFSVRLGSDILVSGRFTPFLEERIPPLITFKITSSVPFVPVTSSCIFPSSTRIFSPIFTSAGSCA